MPHSIGTATISFGLVSIPCRLYSAHKDERVAGHLLHASCGNRLKQQMLCPRDNEVVERRDMIRGYEVLRGSDQYVLFRDEELKALEGAKSNAVDLTEFVPLATIDPVQVETTSYLGPEPGGEKAYALLRERMVAKGVVAIGQYISRGRDHIVMVRPFGKGLCLHELYLSDEVRPFEHGSTDSSFHDAERDAAIALVGSMSADRFAPEKYRDAYQVRLREAIAAKSEGMPVAAAQAAPRAQLENLLEALKRSVAEATEKPASAVTLPAEDAQPPAKAKGGPKKAAPKDEEVVTQKKRGKK